jgi:ATP-dependent Clp protease protease subunit
MARLLALLTTAAAYVTTPPAKLTPGRTSPRSSIVLGPQSVPQVPYSPPGAEQGQHMYVDIYQALYRDRIMLVGNFLDEEQANSLIALLLFMRFEDPRKPISIYFNVPGALMKPCLAVYDTLRTLECPVTTVNLGLATGMGAFLCGAGTKGMRYALPNARFLMQRTGLDDPYQGQASDIGLMVRENLRDNDRMVLMQRLRDLASMASFRESSFATASVPRAGKSPGADDGPPAREDQERHVPGGVEIISRR